MVGTPRGLTTRTLPLIKAVSWVPRAESRLTPRRHRSDPFAQLPNLPRPDHPANDWPSAQPGALFDFNVQEDANEWFTLALFLLDFHNGAVEIGPIIPPPEAPTRPGTLFFDEATLEMSILYDDGNSKQWVPISAVFQENTTRVAAVETRVEQVSVRLQNSLEAIDQQFVSVSRDIPSLSDRVEQFAQALGSLGTNIGTVQVALDAFKADVAGDVTDIDADIAAERRDRESVVATIQLAISELKAQVEQQAQEVNLNALAERVDLQRSRTSTRLGAGKAEATALAELKAAYEATTDNYLPRGGGVLDGQFVMQKSDIALPSIDFSGEVHHGIDAIRWATQNTAGQTELNLGVHHTQWPMSGAFPPMVNQ